MKSMPTNHGESMVLRILDKSNLKLGLPELGFFSDDQESFERLIRLADGIVLVTGPTGSGKTTTLYACLNYINKPDRKIITVEEPIEYQMTGINQVQVNTEIGMIDVGEETGKLPEMLLKVADVFDDEVDNAVAALTSMSSEVETSREPT